MKKKIPPFEECIERLMASMQKRHPDREVDSKVAAVLSLKWEGKHKELFRAVQTLECEEAKLEIKKAHKKNFDYREVDFQIGVDVLGFPIYCQHRVLWTATWSKPPVFSTKGPELIWDENHQFSGVIFKQH